MLHTLTTLYSVFILLGAERKLSWIFFVFYIKNNLGGKTMAYNVLIAWSYSRVMSIHRTYVS